MHNSAIDTILSRAIAFRELHQRSGLFVVPNAWDAGSARVLEILGFEALATTSAGLAFSLGRPDAHASVSRIETLDNVKAIIAATSRPVSADLENGFGNEPESCTETINLAAQTGLAGGSIEDATGNPDDPIYPFDLAVQRVKAAVVAARSQPHPFMLTARAENLIHGRPDLKDTVKRLEAFSDAGADVLFAPGLKTYDEIRTVVNAVAPRPVNVIMGIPGVDFSLEKLAEIGVKRVSLGSALFRAAYGAFFRAAEEISQKGTFSFADHAKPYGEINELFKG
jgi:2-methylisocitrate lyase-like PEP mutase family enzyme